MTDNHVPNDLTRPAIQAAIDQVRAEVRDLTAHIRRHLDAGCRAPGGACPGLAVIERLARASCSHRFDVTVAALIRLAERDAEVAALRQQLIRRAHP